MQRFWFVIAHSNHQHQLVAATATATDDNDKQNGDDDDDDDDDYDLAKTGGKFSSYFIFIIYYFCTVS